MSKWLGLALLMITMRCAGAHEIRPAYLKFQETADHGYDVLWKQPVMGEMAIHLVPHLSGGWLDSKPERRELTPSFELLQWRIPAGTAGTLAGQTVSIEGLENTITDTLVVVRTGGDTWQTVLTPSKSSQRLDFRSDKPALALPLFVKLGFEHILSGIDHLLFLVGLMLLIRDRWMLLKTLTAFTVAHSITLALATLKYVQVPAAWVETEIALSILFLALETVRAYRGGVSLTTRQPWVVAFMFGLLHGFGFAGGLSAAGLPANDIPAALLLFNVGVEAGQIAFVGIVLSLVWAITACKVQWPRALYLIPRYAMGSVAALWTAQRVAILLSGAP
jgi:hydrogenase/urease accessory protein HupE